MGAIIFRDIIEIVAPGGSQSCEQRIETRIGDWSWRKAAMKVGIIGRVQRHIRFTQVAVELAREFQRVDNRRIDSERDTTSQPVYHDGSDQGALLSVASLLFNDRSQRDNSGDVPSLGQRVIDQQFSPPEAKLINHRFQDFFGKSLASESVGVGKQETFQVASRGSQVANPFGLRQGSLKVSLSSQPAFNQTFDDLAIVQTFWNCD